MAAAFAPVSFTAVATVWKIGTAPWNRVPPRFGVTPATTFVPYSSICSAWKLPAEPVMPWTRTRVFLSTKTLTVASALRSLRGRDDLARRVAEVVGGDDPEGALGEDLLPQLDVGALEAHH